MLENAHLASMPDLLASGLQGFLDARGEDFDDCDTFSKLVGRPAPPGLPGCSPPGISMLLDNFERAHRGEGEQIRII